jgi:hypothetical protein
MRRIIFTVLVLATVAVSIAPPVALAADATSQGIVSCDQAAGNGSTACNFCAMVTLGQNVVNFAIVIAIPLAMLFIGWAGFLYMTSAYSPVQIATAHKIFKNTAIGFVAALAAWLIVDTFIHEIVLRYNQNYFSDVGGSWYKVPTCNQARESNKLVSDLLHGVFGTAKPDDGAISVVYDPEGNNISVVCPEGSVHAGDGCADTKNHVFVLPTTYSCPSGSDFDPNSGGCQYEDGLVVVPDKPSSGTFVGNGDIAAAAAAYKGTATNLGPDGGNLACAWAVNNVLKNAGIDPIDGNSVAGMESALKNGRGDYVLTSEARAGDIIVWKDSSAGVSHVGICQTAGCTQAISNSSSRASFANVSGPTFSGVPGRVYHIK